MGSYLVVFCLLTFILTIFFQDGLNVFFLFIYLFNSRTQGAQVQKITNVANMK